MELQAHYDQFFREGVRALETGTYTINELLYADLDQRYGITLLTRPDKAIRTSIRQFLETFKAIDPNQYYYPDSDIHVTILSIISCYEGFQLNQVNPAAYAAIIGEVLRNQPPCTLEFRGITLSPAAIMLRGFVSGDALNYVRDRLRAAFKRSGLEHSIDERYAIFTAHSTVVRYRQKLANPAAWLQKIRENETFYFGKQELNSMEL
ncbi:hypothetical protein, partial [Flavihumibacter sp. CACIAM 22H1]|uniref:2'-5' RNA ligase family protein n=1 Tax=Flavihumibacter sp. CACIAM 22H1 TaxID=1812911 RepID=UPI0007A7D267